MLQGGNGSSWYKPLQLQCLMHTPSIFNNSLICSSAGLEPAWEIGSQCPGLAAYASCLMGFSGAKLLTLGEVTRTEVSARKKRSLWTNT